MMERSTFMPTPWTTRPAPRSAEEYRRLIQESQAALPQATEVEQARLYEQLGRAALVLGEVRTTALDAYTRMTEIALRRTDARLEAQARNGLAAVYDTLGRRHESLREAEKADRRAIAVGDGRLAALALGHQAQFYKENGENERAHDLFTRIGEIGTTLGDDRLVLMSLIGRGRTTPMAAPDTAIALYGEAIALAERLDEPLALSVCYNNLADWKVNTGLYTESIALREQSLRISRTLGDQEGIGRALIGIGKAYTLLGETGKAWEYLNRGLPVVVSAGDLEGELHSALNLAHLYVRGNDIARACEYYGRTLERSLAAPDAACARFAQLALAQLAEGELPRPAILPPQPLTPDFVAAHRPALYHTYPTGDRQWGG
jgi:tetratricopeptide (TPR) repeat protein